MESIQELLAQKAALEKKIADAQRGARADAIAKVKALMSEYGLTAADLAGRSPAGSKASAAAGKKVAAKYRDPSSGQTWTGRGLKPKWLQSAISSGKALEDFAI